MGNLEQNLWKRKRKQVLHSQEETYQMTDLGERHTKKMKEMMILKNVGGRQQYQALQEDGE